MENQEEIIKVVEISENNIDEKYIELDSELATEIRIVTSKEKNS
jgi:hypothetical protein